MRFLFYLLAFLCVFTSGGQAVEKKEKYIFPATEKWHLFGRVINVGLVDGGDNDLTLKQLNFDKWKEYNDGVVSFKYPDSKRVTVVKKKQNSQAIRWPGGRANGWQEGCVTYSVQIDGVECFSLSAYDQEGFKWNQRGYNMRNIMGHHWYRVHGEALAVCRYWTGGRIKDVQISNDEKLLIVGLDEWSAKLKICPLRIEDRETLAMSVRLIASRVSKKKLDWKAKLEKRLGWKSRVSFLYYGIPKKEVHALLGEPTWEGLDEEIWKLDDGNFPISLNVRYGDDDTLVALPYYGIKTNYTRPIRGSVAWMRSIVSYDYFVEGLPAPRHFGKILTSPSKKEPGDDLFGDGGVEPMAANYAGLIPKVELDDKVRSEIINLLKKRLKREGKGERGQMFTLANKLAEKDKALMEDFGKLVDRHKDRSRAAGRVLYNAGDLDQYELWLTHQMEVILNDRWNTLFT